MFLILKKMQRVATLSTVAVALLFLMGTSVALAGEQKQIKRNYNLVKTTTQNELNFNKLVSASENLGGEGSWVVLESNGKVYFQDVDQKNWQPVATKTVLNPGAKIKADKDSWAFLSHFKDRAVLTADSQLVIAPAKKSWVSVILDFGTSLFDVNRRSANRFQVETKYLVATVKGTTFGVNVDEDEASVSVSEGTVGTKKRDGSGESDVKAGQTGRAGTAPGVLVSASTPGKSGAAPPGWSEKAERGKSSVAPGKNAVNVNNKKVAESKSDKSDKSNAGGNDKSNAGGNDNSNAGGNDNSNAGGNDNSNAGGKCNAKKAAQGKCTL